MEILKDVLSWLIVGVITVVALVWSDRDIRAGGTGGRK